MKIPACITIWCLTLYCTCRTVLCVCGLCQDVCQGVRIWGFIQDFFLGGCSQVNCRLLVSSPMCVFHLQSLYLTSKMPGLYFHMVEYLFNNSLLKVFHTLNYYCCPGQRKYFNSDLFPNLRHFFHLSLHQSLRPFLFPSSERVSQR